jgi:hypothetical protein
MDNEQPSAEQLAAPVPMMVDWQTVCVILMARFLPMGERSITITPDDVAKMTAGDYAPAGPVLAVRPSARGVAGRPQD